MSSKLLTATIGGYEELHREVSASDVAEADRFASLHRRCEYLAWRALLYRELGRRVQIAYNENGAPYIVGDNEPYIGVSHCRDRVAVIIGDSPCSVDIERRDRNFRRVASKFLRHDELSLIADQDVMFAIAWSAKECAYKHMTDKPALSDIHLLSIEGESGTIEYEIRGKTFGSMQFVVEKEHVIVTIG